MTIVDKTKAKAEDKLEDASKLAKKGLDKALKAKAEAKKLIEDAPEKTAKLLEKSKREIPSTESLSKVSLWSGLGSLLIGFPANAVALASAAAVEDRRRLVAKGAIKKVLEKRTAPTKQDLVKSRVGAAAGAFSLIAGIVALAVIAGNAAKGASSHDAGFDHFDV